MAKLARLSCPVPDQNSNILTQLQKWFTMKYKCDICGWVYDPAVGVPEAGIPAGTPWEEVPADFECPVCGVSKDDFSEA